MSTVSLPPTNRADTSHSLLTSDDLFLFNEGTHYQLWKKLGAHVLRDEHGIAVHFAVWAPNARSVSVIGGFNDWNKSSNPLSPRGSSGIWEGVIADLEPGANYKYHIESRVGGYQVDKADPFGFREESGGRASVVWALDYDWQDNDWMSSRGGSSVYASMIL